MMKSGRLVASLRTRNASPTPTTPLFLPRNHATRNNNNCISIWSRRSSSSTTTASSSNQQPSSDNKIMFVSRRLWQEYRRQQAPKGKQQQTSKSTATKTEDKPWPRSVQIMGYVSAGTLIPYCTLWLILSNDWSRDLFLPKISPQMEFSLREHFGEPEGDFTIVNSIDEPEPPRRLFGEISYLERLQQDYIDQETNTKDVKVRMRTYPADNEEVMASNHYTNEKVVVVAGNTTANPQTLLHENFSDTTTSSDNVYVAVDFSDSTNTDLQEVEEEATPMKQEEDLEISSSMTPSSSKQLSQKTSVFSSWHYEPPKATSSDGGAAATQSKRYDATDMEILEVEHGIEQLEQSLKGGNDIDDIMEELSKKKQKLRSLKWKKRFNYFF